MNFLMKNLNVWIDIGHTVIICTLLVITSSKNVENTSLQFNDFIYAQAGYENTLRGQPLNPDDFEKGRQLTDKDIYYPGNKNPMEESGHFQGDMVLTDQQMKNALRFPEMLWKGGRIPYEIDSDFDERERSVVARSISEYHEKTCIRFTPRTTEINYVFLTRGQGCFSMIGMTGGRQDVSLGSNCFYVGVVMHELMHAVGFFHEQARTDRDDYVTVLWNNIIPGQEFNFEKKGLDIIEFLGEKYDYDSIMHYSRTSFSKSPSLPTIVPKKDGVAIGRVGTFSDIDRRKLNKLYQCSSSPTKEQTTNGAKEVTKTENEIIPDTDKKCKDTDKFCSLWASKGECQANPKWMLPNCAQSCRQCRKNDLGTSINDVTHQEKMQIRGGCEDGNEHCTYWADQKECTKNPDYMRSTCKRSCGVCSGSDPCHDSNANCDLWVKLRYCITYGHYMREFCRQSCKLC